jgi:hypothetical protein
MAIGSLITVVCQVSSVARVVHRQCQAFAAISAVQHACLGNPQNVLLGALPEAALTEFNEAIH